MLARRIGGDGRTRAYLGGRSIAVGELRELAGELLSFYGQHEHRRLMLAAAQLEILDGCCGAASRRGAAPRPARGTRSAPPARDRPPRRARRRPRARARPARLRAEEIERVAPVPGEDDALAAERSRLRNLEALRARRLGRRAGARGRGRGRAARDRRGGRRARGHRRLRPALEPLAARARALAIEAQDLAPSCATTARRSSSSPAASMRVEERLAAIDRLRAQARRDDRGGARTRRALPCAARASWRGPRSRWRPRGAARGGARRACRGGRRAQRRAGAGGAGARRGGAGGSRRSPWGRRASA